MTTLARQPIAHRMNNRANVEAENARMDELERRATPIFYLVMMAAATVIVGVLVDEYADRKHATSAQHEHAFAQCLDGKSVKVDGSIASCEVKKYALVGGLK